MTDIQVKYWDLQESKRHNVATEGETYRHNVVSEQQNAVALGETVRHNRATEAETQRHNQQQEKLGFATLDETIRHNKRTEAYQMSSLAEAIRHNKANEGIAQLNASASMMQAEAARQNAKTNADKAKYENAYKESQTEYQNLTNWDLEHDNYLRESNFIIEELLSPIGSALRATGLSGSEAGDMVGTIATMFL